MEFVIIKQAKDERSGFLLNRNDVAKYLRANKPSVVLYSGIEPVNGTDLMCEAAFLNYNYHLRVTIYKASIHHPYFKKLHLTKGNA